MLAIDGASKIQLTRTEASSSSINFIPFNISSRNLGNSLLMATAVTALFISSVEAAQEEPSALSKHFADCENICTQYKSYYYYRYECFSECIKLFKTACCYLPNI